MAEPVLNSVTAMATGKPLLAHGDLQETRQMSGHARAIRRYAGPGPINTKGIGPINTKRIGRRSRPCYQQRADPSITAFNGELRVVKEAKYYKYF